MKTAHLKIFLWILLLLAGEGAANAAPVIKLAAAESYCVVYCYIRVPFTIASYDPKPKMGRVFCEFDAEVTAQLPVYNGEARTKNMQASPIGVFKNDAGNATGDVEMSTGIVKKYFVGAKVNSVRCHL